MSGQQTDQDTVRCHSGYTYAQRPVSFIYKGEEYRVKRILTENRTPDGKKFRVETELGLRFELNFSESTGGWQIRMI